ncbi:succinate dehydrogenase iron-sulfur subunit [bacterium]|jgi:succinate dehydrogenase / fumarate reductase iron-sulfur subunit|nr:succinate dehydrogenase iron-sulfur subunit [bacterium]NBX72653.1 succinate dehydrogenase iron-sulfur subunit [bacterium]
MKFYLYRWQEGDKTPRMQEYDVDIEKHRCVMLLDVLEVIKEIDPTVSFRRSCGEGVCGSDAMNINGKNGLACITELKNLKEPVFIRPLPSMPVIRDLVVDLQEFYNHYKKIQPFLEPQQTQPTGERLQSPQERDKLDGLYECILCACCTSSCPSYWWNPDKFLGPAALLQASRFILDSRDDKTRERLEQLNDAYALFRCHSIMNCVDACPKGLNPNKAIHAIISEMVKKDI